jgi:hypothetical protein
MFQYTNIKLIDKFINNNWTAFVQIEGNEYNVNTVISIDAASSYDFNADDTAIVWIAKDNRDRLYVLRTKSGKFAITDELKPTVKITYVDDYKKMALAMNYQDYITRIGCVDEVFRWLSTTKTKPKIIIETNNTGNEVVKQFYQRMNLYGMRYMVEEVVQTRNKIERILDTLQPYYQSRAVWHQVGQDKLSHQLQYIGKTKHDDEADAFATGVSKLRKPPLISVGQTETTKEKKIKILPQIIRKFKTSPSVTREWLTK